MGLHPKHSIFSQQHFFLQPNSDIGVQYLLKRKGNTNCCELLMQFPYGFSPSLSHGLLKRLTRQLDRGENYVIYLKNQHLPMQLML